MFDHRSGARLSPCSFIKDLFLFSLDSLVRVINVWSNHGIKFSVLYLHSDIIP